MKRTYLLAFLLLFCGLVLHAQEYRGTITGLVTDPTGGRVAAVDVTATNLATQMGFHSTSNESGAYTLPLLPPGEYKLTATAKGFKTFERSPVLVQVQSCVEINVPLELGALGEVVNVSADSPMLETWMATV